MKPRVVAIIQGRMNSSRLPGKILADLDGQPMLARVFVRTSRAAAVSETIFATTTDSSDDSVAEYCEFSGIPYARGSQFDVLERYYDAAKQADAQVIVRITADCPLMDPALIDEVVNTLVDDGCDFVCNRLPPPWHRTYPIGLDVEACTKTALEQVFQHASEPQQREHVMPYLYEGVELRARSRTLEAGTSPRGFKVALLNNATDFGSYRWTVDTPEDLEFMREIYRRLNGRDDFAWKDILDFVHDDPALMQINAAVEHKTLKDVDKRALKKR